MKSILVIGMGRFGKHLALKLLELGNEVMIVDQDEEKIEPYASLFTDSHIGDCSNEAVLRSLGINNFDVCFVAISEDFQASLEITSMLREMGAKYIVSRANRDRQARFCLKSAPTRWSIPSAKLPSGWRSALTAKTLPTAWT